MQSPGFSGTIVIVSIGPRPQATRGLPYACQKSILVAVPYGTARSVMAPIFPVSDERRQWCCPHRSSTSRTAMKTIVSALIALSVLAGIAAPASAHTNAKGAQERCAEAPVDVTASSPSERRLACSAANHALQLLGRCRISLRRPLHVEIAKEVRHPFSGPIFGLFDAKQERVLVTQYANIPSLVSGTPYSELPQREFYNSLIVHEIVHGVMHQNLKRPATSHSAYEYAAYALQIESLPSSLRDKFLQTTNNRAGRSAFVFNDSILFFDPFFFAARAYEHFKASADGCAHLLALLEGEVAFILTMPLL